MLFPGPSVPCCVSPCSVIEQKAQPRSCALLVVPTLLQGGCTGLELPLQCSPRVLGCREGAVCVALAPEKQGDFLKNRKIWERGTQLVTGGGNREDTVVALCSHTWFFVHDFTAGATARAAQVLSAR